MSDFISEEASTPVFTGVGRWLDKLSLWFALTGGAIFIALVAMSIVSILGRKLFSSPIQGDLELMQIGSAVGAAAFLPLCELYDHNIKVDALTGWLSERGQQVLDGIAHLLLCVFAGILTWRTALSVPDVKESFEVSALLGVPMWIPVCLLVPSLGLLTLAALYRAYLSFVGRES